MPYFPCVVNASVTPGLGRARSSGLSQDLDPSVPVAEVTLLRECWHRVFCWALGHWELLCDVPPDVSPKITVTDTTQLSRAWGV